MASTPIPITKPAKKASAMVKIDIKWETSVFPWLTDDVDLDRKCTSRIGRAATKRDLIRCIETGLFEWKPGEKKEDHELFKHGRREQWGWDVYLRAAGTKDWVRLRDEKAKVDSFACEDGKGTVEVLGVICYDPDWEEWKEN